MLPWAIVISTIINQTVLGDSAPFAQCFCPVHKARQVVISPALGVELCRRQMTFCTFINCNCKIVLQCLLFAIAEVISIYTTLDSIWVTHRALQCKWQDLGFPFQATLISSHCLWLDISHARMKLFMRCMVYLVSYLLCLI